MINNAHHDHDDEFTVVIIEIMIFIIINIIRFFDLKFFYAHNNTNSQGINNY